MPQESADASPAVVATAGIVMLYLPGTNMNGVVAVDDPRYSLPLFMATHGVDFWALDYRTHFIPPATPASDLTELKGWTNDLFESDILAAAEFDAARHRSSQDLHRGLQPRREPSHICSRRGTGMKSRAS